MKRRVFVVCLVLTSIAGCGKSDQQQAEEAAKQIEEGAQKMQQGAQQMPQASQQSADQMAQGLQQMAQGFQQMAQGSGAKAVDYESLKALLPEVSGWTKADSRGEQLSMPVAYSRAEANYRKGDGRVELEVTDTALSQLLLAPMSMFLNSGYSERSDDGFKRSAKIKGQPGFEEWNVASKRGEVTAVVANRFILHATGHDVESLEAVRLVAESVDVGKLAALK